MTTAPEPPTRSARKRAAILAAALDRFLERGYREASMDEIAAAAGVSKQTVYKHFGDKRGLFGEVVAAAIDEAAEPTEGLVARLGTSDDVAGDLRRFARRHIADVTQPHLMRLRRMVIAEGERFPELARAWRAAGPDRAHAALAAQLAELDRRGRLRIADPALAAEQLNWLILSIPLHRRLFDAAAPAPPPAERQRLADEAVRIFMAAYRPAPDAGS